ncbi:hypothetical protein NPS01_35970 [Nocardioides psychrotolerans]|nr:hypothetical protein NPS01_35970 [Nocardioides psychrotolerans]
MIVDQVSMSMLVMVPVIRIGPFRGTADGEMVPSSIDNGSRVRIGAGEVGAGEVGAGAAGAAGAAEAGGAPSARPVSSGSVPIAAPRARRNEGDRTTTRAYRP